MTYPEVFSRLTFETAIVTFIKKNGEVRVMLCTRNLNTASLKYGFKGQELGGHDNRCNINNGNIAVIDLIIGEARSFSITRLVDVQWCGVVGNKSDMDTLIEKFSNYRKEYEKNFETGDLLENLNV